MTSQWGKRVFPVYFQKFKVASILTRVSGTEYTHVYYVNNFPVNSGLLVTEGLIDW